MRGYPQHHFGGPRFFGGGFGMLCALIIIGLLVYLVVQSRRDRDDRRTVVTTSSPAVPGVPPATPGLLTPAEVIRMRYARGEITREQFETMRQDLG